MNKITQPYQVVDLPLERRWMPAFLELKGGKHCIYALMEVDVTLVRQFIERYKAHTSEQLSFTGYLIFCLAHAVAEDKAVQAYRKGRKQLIMFDDVDVGFMIEMQRGEKQVLTGHVIRGADHKTYREINDEIRSVQSYQEPASADTVSWIHHALLLPWPLSRLFNAFFRMAVQRDPTIVTSMSGTVGISSVGMFGKGHAGWGISTGSHVLDLIVGGTARKLAEVEGRIESRQVLSLTIVFDHDVIDGAPATRFTRRLVELIESGYGLDEFQAQAAQETEPAATRAV
jgi:pyruvate/2-oxoglutarate dehydrogenase complex dihydrolipoamide acyltransferase (E2) component